MSKGYRSPGRRALRDSGRVWWPSIYKDDKGREHRRMYVKNPVKFVFSRWPYSKEADSYQHRLISEMLAYQNSLEEKGYMDGRSVDSQP